MWRHFVDVQLIDHEVTYWSECDVCFIITGRHDTDKYVGADQLAVAQSERYMVPRLRHIGALGQFTK